MSRVKKPLIISEANENKDANEMIQPEEKLIKNSEIQQLKEKVIKLEVLLANKKKLQEDIEESDEIKIHADDRIRIMSLCPHYLTLTTETKGKGKQYNFAKFGEIHVILYADLLEIIRNNRHFVEDGYFYIMSQRCIIASGLEDIYERVLTKEKILEIIDCTSVDTSIELFKTANNNQRDLIVEMLINKTIEGESIDLNFLDRISRIYDKDKSEDVHIRQRIEDMKKQQSLLSR